MICKGSIAILGANDKSGHVGYEASHETEDSEGKKMPRKTTVRRRDSFAVALQGAQYRKRVVKSGKVYSRKAKALEQDVVK